VSELSAYPENPFDSYDGEYESLADQINEWESCGIVPQVKVRILPWGAAAPRQLRSKPTMETGTTVSVSATAAAYATQDEFDAAYWLHQPAAVQALGKLPSQEARTSLAAILASEGYLIDVPIMVWGWDAYLVMLQRKQYGYTWVPSALMPPVEVAPGFSSPGALPYDPLHPPAGAIMVSINIGDYPPLKPPPPVAVPAAAPTSLVGNEEGLGSGYFQAYPAARTQLTEGEVYKLDPRGPFVFHITESPFAPNGGVAFFNPAPGNLTA